LPLEYSLGTSPQNPMNALAVANAGSRPPTQLGRPAPPHPYS
jgi:hypothetical protein